MKNFLFSMIIIFVLWGVYGYFVNFLPWHQRGVFGDSYGSLTALFSGWAFAGIILTMRVQMDELRLQRNELTLQRMETKRSADAQESLVFSTKIQNRLDKTKIRINCWESEINYLSARIGSFGANSKLQENEIKRVEEILRKMEEELELLDRNAPGK